MKEKIKGFVYGLLSLGFFVLTIYLIIKNFGEGVRYFDGSVLKYLFFSKHVVSFKYIITDISIIVSFYMSIAFLKLKLSDR